MNHLPGPRQQGTKTPNTPTGKNWRHKATYIRKLNIIEREYMINKKYYDEESKTHEKFRDNALVAASYAAMQELQGHWNILFRSLRTQEKKKALKWAKKLQ